MRETCQGITCDCQSECRHDEHCPSCPDLHSGERWTCFHCAETFTDRETAREHFGASETERAGCQLNTEEGGLLAALRKAEAELASYRSEDTEKDRAYYRLQSDHAVALRRAEERGYERGLKDGQELRGADTPGGADLLSPEERKRFEKFRYLRSIVAEVPLHTVSETGKSLQSTIGFLFELVDRLAPRLPDPSGGRA